MVEKPPELLDLDDLTARAKAYAEHAKAEYDRAEREYQALIEKHCTEVCERMHRWACEGGRVGTFLRSLERAREQHML